MYIYVTKDTETLGYAAEELKKYIRIMSEGKIIADVIRSEEKKCGEGITLGLLSELSLDTSDLKDPVLEDIIDLRVDGLSGYIAGSNERSVLMGVYKYCYSLGCRYTRPGENGDYVPTADVANHSFSYRKKADKLFRGECCEGAISYEHMRDTVYWLPKIGMNMYMIEGLVPYTYMHKWYGHVNNTKLRIPGQITEYESLEKYIPMLEADVKRVGIQLHTLGHAWMFEGFGIHHTDPKRETDALAKLTEREKNYLALVNGKRGICHNSSFFTHFCYSNPDARAFLIDYLISYVKKKPAVDFIHVWLADSTNNQCECEECEKKTPSDWYVILLNELDQRLAEIGSDARIVFIMYVDTVRPPIEERLLNPKRFVLLTAIGSFYEQGYRKLECKEEIPPFKRNSFVGFSDALKMKCHDDWKALSGGIPSIIYEYRYYTDMYCDLSHMRLSRETYRDMRALDEVSFNGCMSDQTHRMYMPTALPLITMGETLLDRDTDFERLANEYFEGAFGKGWQEVRRYLEELTPLLSPSSFRVGGAVTLDDAGFGDLPSNERPCLGNPEVAALADKIPEHVGAFLPTIKHRIAEEQDATRRLSWIYLSYHAEIVLGHGRVLAALGKNDIDAARAAHTENVDWISEHELEFHNVFDLWLYTSAVYNKLKMPRPSYYA